jgi:arylsulfatase A-like enzyme
MNMLVVSLPGLRLHHLGCYGNEWLATAAFDRLASQGVVFDHHYADSLGASAEFRPEWTGFPRHATLLPAKAVPAFRGRPLQRLLEDRAVHCVFPDGLSFSTGKADSSWGKAFGRVWDSVKGLSSNEPWCVWAEVPSLAPPWGLPIDVLSAYLDEEDESPPWSGAACGPGGVEEVDYLSLLQTYAAVVTHVDGALEGFLEQLQTLSGFEELLLILTSDRGLALGEHGIVGEYRPWLHDELVHLPLLMRLPGAAEAGRRVTALTQPVDLFATVLDAFGLHTPETAGRSLLPLARGEQSSGREFVCTSFLRGEALEWSLRTRDWAYLLPVRNPPGDPTRSPQLYAKPEDAWEVNDVRYRHLELAEQLEHRLRSDIEGIAPGVPDEHRDFSG